MNKYRTHTCGELNLTHKGTKITLSGWINKKRDHGNLLFIDLRDNYGLTQCVIDKSNSIFSDYYFNILNTHILVGTQNFGLNLSVLHWINDALMAIFFFIVTLEIKREFIQGELSKPKQALLPIIGAIGGMAVPAIIYIVIN